MKQKAILIGPNGQNLDVLNAQLEKKWKVVHIAAASTSSSAAWLVVVEESPSSPQD